MLGVALAAGSRVPTAGAQEATPEPSASPAAASVDPAIAKRARDWFGRVQAAKIDRTQLTPDFSARFTDDNAAGLAKQTADLGDPVAFDFVRSIEGDDQTTYIFKIAFKTGVKLSWAFSLDSAGKIARFALKPG